MAITKWDPFRDLENFFDEDFGPRRAVKRFGWDISADVYEEGDNVIAEVNMPGVDPKNVDLSVEGEILKITGNREEKKESEEKGYYTKEIRRGSFERNIKLPNEVKIKKAKAEFENGVLKITLPKGEPKSNKIKIDVKDEKKQK